MNVRPAEPEDWNRIRDLSEQSFQASYSLSPGQIETVLETAFSEEVLTARATDPDVLLLVAEDEVDDRTEIVGFADADLGDGTLNWLHVDPTARGGGVGTRLFEQVREAVADEDQSLTVNVLEEASEGGEFFTKFGLTTRDTEELEFGSETLFAHVYAEGGGPDDAPNTPNVDVPERVSVEDQTVYLDSDEEIPGTEAPFFRVFESDQRDDQYGFFCSNCGSTDVSADGLDGLECGNCGNTHLADEWDGAYL